MENDNYRVTGHIRGQFRSAVWLLEETVSDVTEEIAHFAPPGKALPIAAAWAHFVTGADWMIHDLLQGSTPLFAGSWAGRTGLSEMQPGPELGAEWNSEFVKWCRRLRVDLPAFRLYAKAVYEAADAYLASLPDSELSRTLDLSPVGMGTQTVAFVFDNAIVGHAFCHCGEISALKGINGMRGYPF